jgi:ATP-dependent Zn protease
LSKLRKKLDALAAELLQKETLEAEEFEKLIGAKPAFAKASAGMPAKVISKA